MGNLRTTIDFIVHKNRAPSDEGAVAHRATGGESTTESFMNP